jgi:hypothetical protein
MSTADQLLDIDKFYERDAEGTFVSAIATGFIDASLKRCPECKAQIFGLQRYNRRLKRCVLDLILKSLIVRSHQKLDAIHGSFATFEAEVEKSRPDELKKVRQIHRPKDKRPYTDHNLNITTTRKEYFTKMRKQIREFRETVDERKQPHVKVYEMSMAARARAREEHGDEIGFEALDVPQPDLKFRVEADALGLRLETVFLEDHMEFLSRLVSCGCKEEAHDGYRHVISKCKENGKSAEKHRISCDGGAHYRSAIEFMLLQLHFVSLERRSTVAISSQGKTENLSKRGLQIIESCEIFIREHPRQRFTNGEFRQAVTGAERKAIAQAMRAEFSGTGHWYQCRNGHPVILLRFLLELIRSLRSANVGCPWNALDVPNVGNPSEVNLTGQQKGCLGQLNSIGFELKKIISGRFAYTLSFPLMGSM